MNITKICAFIPAALLCLACPGAFAQSPPAARAAKFLQTFAKADPDGKALAFDLLDPADDPAVINACFKVLDDPFPQVHAAAVKFLSSAESGRAAAHLLEKGLAHRDPLVRAACATAASRMKEPALDSVVPLLADSAWMARCAAVEAIAEKRHEPASAAVAALISDPDPRVRTAAVLALGRFRDLGAAGELSKALEDPAWQARSAAIEVAKAWKPKAAFAALIERLAEEKGRLRLEALSALTYISGRDLGDDPQTWREWWLAQTRKKGEEGFVEPESSDYVIKGKKSQSRRFFTAETDSRSVVFVLDVSESMNGLCKPRPADAGTRMPERTTRFSVLLEEIELALKNFEDKDEFNVVVFGTKADAWKPQMQKATAAARTEAVSFLRARAPSGETNLFDALARAFGVSASALSSGKGYFDEMAGMKGGMNYEKGPDTIFLLTDGVPNRGLITDGDAIAAELARANRTRRIVIHTVAVGQFQADFLRRIALENKGSWVVVSE